MSSESQNSDEQDFQRMWKVASTAQFVNIFRQVFKLPEIEIETLEEGLLNQNMYGIHVVKELVVALLKFVYGYPVSLNNYESYLQKVGNKIWISEETQEENPFKKNIKFEDMAPVTKLDILYCLCLRFLDKASHPKSKFKKRFSKIKNLRTEPLGCDNDGNEYWYFYATRLYKQQPPNRLYKQQPPNRKIKYCDESEGTLINSSRSMSLGEKSLWSVVCESPKDWIELADKFIDCKSECERALFQVITDFLPVINEISKEKEKKLQQKLEDEQYPAMSRELRVVERNRHRNQGSENGPRSRCRSMILSNEDSDDDASKSPRNRYSSVENNGKDFAISTSERPRKRLTSAENDKENLVARKSKKQRSCRSKH